jgi:OOP family OmpA-OmpF porin
MRIPFNAFSAALLAAGCSFLAAPVVAETRFYDPTNAGGRTAGHELYGTIGCPGRQLLDPPVPATRCG